VEFSLVSTCNRRIDPERRVCLRWRSAVGAEFLEWNQANTRKRISGRNIDGRKMGKAMRFHFLALNFLASHFSCPVPFS
jgi:hypothetical protein